MRTPYLAGNWKMNLERQSALGLVAALREHVDSRAKKLGDQAPDVGVAPPFVYLEAVIKALDGSPIRVGAQNVCDQENGAFTGEISAEMLADVGVDFVIVGHSERRHVYGETDAMVATKLQRVLGVGLDVILCVGETIEERQAGQTESVVKRQLSSAVEGLASDALPKITVAYEPVWAIGTGHTATPEQAGEVHHYLRGLWNGLFDAKAAEALRIQYGGSVKPSNVAELISVPDVDGALVGGASLTPDNFLPIVDLGKA